MPQVFYNMRTLTRSHFDSGVSLYSEIANVERRFCNFPEYFSIEGVSFKDVVEPSTKLPSSSLFIGVERCTVFFFLITHKKKFTSACWRVPVSRRENREFSNFSILRTVKGSSVKPQSTFERGQTIWGEVEASLFGPFPLVSGNWLGTRTENRYICGPGTVLQPAHPSPWKKNDTKKTYKEPEASQWTEYRLNWE